MCSFAAEESRNVPFQPDADSLRENLADWILDAVQYGSDPGFLPTDDPPDEILPFIDKAQAAFGDRVRDVARCLPVRRFRLADLSVRTDLRTLREWWLCVIDENGASVKFNSVIPHVLTKHDTYSAGSTAYPVPVRVPYVRSLVPSRDVEKLDFSRSGLEAARKSFADKMRRARPGMLFQRRDGVRPLLDALICVADRKPGESPRGIVTRTLKSFKPAGAGPDLPEIKRVERQYREVSARVSAYSDQLLPF